MASSMQVSVETLEGLQRKLVVQLPGERIEGEITQRLQELSKRAKVDGFRPGKVPFNVVQKRFGPQIREEVQSEMIQTSFREAVAEKKLHLAGSPEIQAMPQADAAAFSYAATFEIFPEVKLADCSKLKIEKAESSIADADMDEMLAKLREQRVDWETAEQVAKMGDRVTLDFVGKADGEAINNGSAEDYPLVLGSNSMVPDFEEQLVGVKPEDEKTINVDFPDNLHSKELAGKKGSFDVKVKIVEQPRLPELNDAFAETLGLKEGGMAALKDKLRENMQREMEQSLRNKLKDQVMDALVAANKLDLPEVAVKGEIQRLREQLLSRYGEGADPAMFKDDSLFEERARRQVTLGLVVAEIIKQNDFKADADKVHARVEEMALSYDDPQQVINHYRSQPQMMQAIESLVLEDMVVEWVAANAKTKAVQISFKDLTQPTTEANAETN